MVSLKFTEEVKQYSQSDLRPHMYWTHGRWVTMINGKRVAMINGNWVPYFKVCLFFSCFMMGKGRGVLRLVTL